MKKLMLTSLLSVVGFSHAGPVSPILLTVDISNPSATVFTATGAFPLISDNTVFYSSGVTLKDFFTANVAAAINAVSSTLQAPNGALKYNARTGLPTAVDFNLWCSSDAVGGCVAGVTTTQNFKNDVAAFTGEIVFDLTGQPLPSVGVMGDIILGDENFNMEGQTIGQWKVVPIPAAAWMFGSALLGMVGVQRRKTS